jgi:pimeloyl-ACP methyl ester carboxylesterase
MELAECRAARAEPSGGEHAPNDVPHRQDWLRARQPPLQVIWGRYDPSFQVEEAEAYRRDVPRAEVHVLDAGHFALDEQPDEIAGLIRDFLQRQPRGSRR